MTHALPHSIVPGGQMDPQVPPMHDAVPPDGALQTVPHAPQLWVSLESVTHDVPQSESPVAQPLVHVNEPPLAEHMGVDAGHEVPHAPQ